MTKRCCSIRRRSVIRYTIRHWVGCGNTGSDVALAVYLVSLRALTLLKRDEVFCYLAVSAADTSQQVATVTPAPESRSGRKVASSVAG